jgi:hypothetical protein
MYTEKSGIADQKDLSERRRNGIDAVSLSRRLSRHCAKTLLVLLLIFWAALGCLVVYHAHALQTQARSIGRTQSAP